MILVLIVLCTIIGCFFFSPLPPDELAAIIYDACGEDHSTASLTQASLNSKDKYPLSPNGQLWQIKFELCI